MERWVELDAGVLTYFKASAPKKGAADSAPTKKTEKGNVPLATVSKLDKVSWKAGLVFELHTSQRVWYFKCEEDGDLQAWVAACVEHLKWVRAAGKVAASGGAARTSRGSSAAAAAAGGGGENDVAV